MAQMEPHLDNTDDFVVAKQCWYLSEGLPSFSHDPTSTQAEETRNWEVTQTETGRKDIPYYRDHTQNVM